MSEKIWPVIQDAFNAIGPHYQDYIQASLAEAGFEGPDWFFTYLAYGSESVTAVSLQQTLAYFSLKRIQERLTQAAEHGFLKEVGDDEYAVTAKGREGIDSFFKTARVGISKITPLSDAKMEKLAQLLKHVVNETIEAPEPAAKPNLLISRHSAPAPEANAAVQIDQYLTDLLRYRDDAHIAAWSSYGVSGYAWEAFTLIWRGDLNTLADLIENRQNRGYDVADYADALNDLIQRGWLSETDGIYECTITGRQVREQAEARTNQLFSIGILSLDKAEIEKLVTLLIEFKDGLAVPEAEEEPVPA